MERSPRPRAQKTSRLSRPHTNAVRRPRRHPKFTKPGYIKTIWELLTEVRAFHFESAPGAVQKEIAVIPIPARIALFVCAMPFIATPHQALTGTITGAVTDASQAAIPKAQVT